MLEIPITIRLPRPDEMPERQDLEQLLAKRKTANIVEGYRITYNTTPQLPFDFLAEININNSRLWDLFLALCEAFPDQVTIQYGRSDEEPILSALFSKQSILDELAFMKQELVMDGSLVLGLLSHTRQELIEIIVTESKYIKFWGTNKRLFNDVMTAFGLKEVAGLEFIDEYPKVTEPLRRFNPAARRPEDVIWKLDKLYSC